MDIDTLYKLKINDNEKSGERRNGKEGPEIVKRLKKDLKQFIENGDVVRGIRWRVDHGKEYWANMLVIYNSNYNTYLWHQLYEMLEKQDKYTNIFEYLFAIIDEYHIPCECVAPNCERDFMNNLEIVLKRINFNFITDKELSSYTVKKMKENLSKN